MAPAGSRESLVAAIEAGADSVYFGVGTLNMRAGASRAFSAADLPEIVRICRERGVKSYLTLNTVVFDDDLALLQETVAAAKAAGIDAVIAADVAVIDLCRRAGLEVHLSTQLNIANLPALRFYAQYADVAVLARELTLEQVSRMTQAVRTEPILGPSGRPVRIEMFCHGALCMAVSGKCYMSLHTRGKSANRGECLQTCRREYVVKDRERDIELALDSGYVMSPKDLKTIDFVEDMVRAGVRVFKIEGRARGAEYVKTVVSCYDEALAAAVAGGASPEQKADWNRRLSEVFNRGFWEGYYLGVQTAQLTDGYGSKATLVKRFAGTCINYFARAGVAQFRLQSEGFEAGARLLVIGPTTGAVEFAALSFLVDDKPAAEARKGEEVTVKVPQRVRENDKLYVLLERETGT